MQWRQGDVLIESIPEDELKGKEANSNLLVRGEGRYHGHYATGNVTVLSDGSEIFLRVHSKAQIEHLHTQTLLFTGEHAPIDLPKGTYRIIRQREYNPYLKAIELIQD
ncbi:hypothetical protein [Schleiferia thermophila]|jgi:hypothetical protein|uniref:Uncharacterized protein n=1 Tax=Schleiferia thermophila TaxID=884107 RepID=A0A369A5I1_9FLAO|nr:hypothetical protein [Schleiferia thermophila]KFD39177.1 hypothetical protein AT05_06355 [Schleiferia thermophila str. Yellowstone]RCX03327.1 hypothetical protein DES35_103212 [Schleiferia thermophila]GCD80456.1 hypothetical protein JCM30197_17030 [Schleiferia thermophila]